MNIQLADKTVRIPRGIIEDILVKIDKFTVILDMGEDNSIPLILGRPFLATARTKIDVSAGELILCVVDESISLQALDSVRTSSSQGENINSINNHSVKPSFQEAPRNYTIEPDLSSHTNKEITHKERHLQIDDLDEWKTHFEKKLGIHEAEPAPFCGTNKFKIGDQVLLDKADPRIPPPNPNTNKEISFRVLKVFPYETVEISIPHGLTHGRGRVRMDTTDVRTDMAEIARHRTKNIFKLRAPTEHHGRAMRPWPTLF
ncbi:protein kinase 2B, chloroplastic-like [Gossypium australe]|uniref:Protein kinase 2B, chloroplastic-like n=1 Tax=Gossypium australe TaxID=47621 RepID=A0A5B6V992_9ROSI|nr:protein kinase 2B, chloroplastic-like [Gossypium australe]